MRDRLIELLKEADKKVQEYILENDHMDWIPKPNELTEVCADYLLANGVIVPPCKVGQTVYVVRSQTSNGKNLYLREERVDHYRVFDTRTFMCFESNRMSVSDYLWETTVFLTREEAEAKLKEGVQE